MNWEITTFIAYFVILLGVALVFYRENCCVRGLPYLML